MTITAPNHSNETSPDGPDAQDRARRGRALPDHLHLDPDPRPLRPGAERPDYILGPGPDTPVLVGALLELIVALAGIGTAVALFPVVKRQNEGVALGLRRLADSGRRRHLRRRRQPAVAVTLRQAGAGAGWRWSPVRRWSPPTTGPSSSDRASCRPSTPCCSAPCCTGPAWCPGSFPWSGSSERPCCSPPIRRAVRPVGPDLRAVGLLALPIALWEFSLGVYLVVKGFKPSPITAGMTAAGHRHRPTATRSPSSHRHTAGPTKARPLSTRSAGPATSPIPASPPRQEQLHDIDTHRKPAIPVQLTGELDPNLSRWLWLVKMFLAIPHYIVLAFLWVAFVRHHHDRRLRHRVHRPLSALTVRLQRRVLRWNWRVGFYVYAALGTDRYPPFTLGPDRLPGRHRHRLPGTPLPRTGPGQVAAGRPAPAHRRPHRRRHPPRTRGSPAATGPPASSPSAATHSSTCLSFLPASSC